MELEKAILKLKAICKQCHNSRECWNNEFCSDCYIEVEDVFAIETLLKAYEKLKKENTMLENTKMNCPHFNTSGVSCDKKFCNLDDYISKENIREKIENEVIDISGFKCIAVEVLQDLVKEE